MVLLYTYVKYLHVVLAIVAVGANATYGVWLARTAKTPQHWGHVLRTIKFLDDRIANPCYGLLLVTGLLMAYLGPVPLTTRWIEGALALYLVVLVLAAAGYTPTLRKQIEALDARGSDSPEFQRLNARGRVLGIVLAVLVLAIVFLMVVKPTV